MSLPAHGKPGVVALRTWPVLPGGAHGRLGFPAPRPQPVRRRRCLPCAPAPPARSPPDPRRHPSPSSATALAPSSPTHRLSSGRGAAAPRAPRPQTVWPAASEAGQHRRSRGGGGPWGRSAHLRLRAPGYARPGLRRLRAQRRRRRHAARLCQNITVYIDIVKISSVRNVTTKVYMHILIS
ncbi:hypothetical protein PAHAL_4G173200 [Panicum hallii]|uniref:Uncharacterized protein n=1 Tax=Panicum hallii TaxID=206008 RepID=A0A2T8JD92_9POAL|nr:hypothetical protein PAHAL_4G173200 [Panicum hallii]